MSLEELNVKLDSLLALAVRINKDQPVIAVQGSSKPDVALAIRIPTLSGAQGRHLVEFLHSEAVRIITIVGCDATQRTIEEEGYAAGLEILEVTVMQSGIARMNSQSRGVIMAAMLDHIHAYDM